MAGPTRKPPDEITPEEMSSFPVNPNNDTAIQVGQNLPNHSESLAGRGHFIRTGVTGPLVFRTKQALYRHVARLMILSEKWPLANEPGDHTYQEVEEAVRQNS